MYAEVAVTRPTHHRPPAGGPPQRLEPGQVVQAYTYALPARLRDDVAVGHLVLVPLRSGHALGVVVALSDAPPPNLTPEALRDVSQLLDPMPVMTPAQIDLARWIADEYLAPLSQSIRLMLPPGLEERTTIVITRTGAGEAVGLNPSQARALRLLEQGGGRIRLSALAGQLGGEDPEDTVHALAEAGLVDSRVTLVPPEVQPARIHYVDLVADERTIRAAVPRLGRASAQADVLLELARLRGAPYTLPEMCQKVGCTPAPVHALAERGWVTVTAPRTLLVALAGAETTPAIERAPKQRALLEALRARGAPVDQARLLGEVPSTLAIVTALEDKGLVRRIAEPALVLLALAPDQVLERILELRGGETERAVLEALRGATERVWVGGLYSQTGATLKTLQRLAGRGLISLHAEAVDRPAALAAERPHVLTADQAAAYHVVEQGLDRRERGEPPFVALLHGVTGSGKTEVYLHAIEHVLKTGDRAIVLVPEIGLTAQALRRFEARFPGRVAVMHSRLSEGQRYRVWDQVRRGRADVLIGPRSALLAPIPRLGLVVVDEAHDGSYKQSEPIPLPPYHACDAAVALGRITGAAVVMGSATPDLVMYRRAKQGVYRLLELPTRAPAAHGAQAPAQPGALPPVRVVDLRQELRAGNRSIFSRALQEAMKRTLDAREQAILFLNRRGSATFVLCRDCGYVTTCPSCDVPLTYHKQAQPSDAQPASRRRQVEGLVCHRCNHRAPAPEACPECGGRRIRYFGLGAERVEAELAALFPQARLLRWDSDTAGSADPERFLEVFIEHRADVLVGTQMIAKGLDLPLVTLVSVVSADTGLDLPDFAAPERTFQLLVQVAGRAGRSHRGGEVIVQTYHPDHYAIRAAAAHDFAGFYARELAFRRGLGYPPFGRLAALRFSDPDPRLCQEEAGRVSRWLADEVHRLGLRIDLIGPAPCFFGRVQGRSRWQIVVRGDDPMPLLRDVALPWGWRVDVDPVSLL